LWIAETDEFSDGGKVKVVVAWKEADSDADADAAAELSVYGILLKHVMSRYGGLKRAFTGSKLFTPFGS
jgi:hypothetical protein